MSAKQLWLLTGGNGAGKTTFYRLFLEPKDVKLVNADVIAKKISPENPEKVSYEAAGLAERLREDLLYQGASFCFETVFSHESKIDFVGKAKAQGYEVVLVYIHLESPALNEGRVKQRVTEGGHDVPLAKLYNRIPRTMNNIAETLMLVDEARLLDNSSRQNPFQQIAIVKQGKCRILTAQTPEWAKKILKNFQLFLRTP